MQFRSEPAVDVRAREKSFPLNSPAYRTLLIFVALVTILHFVLWLPLPLVVQNVAVLALLGLVPGLLLVALLLGQSEAPPDRWERWLYSVGAGYVLLTLGMLLISYLPGGVAAWQVLVGFDGLMLVMGVLWWRREQRLPPSAAAVVNRRISWGIIAALSALLISGSLLRFHNLGYAEFLTDEARVVLRAAAVVQGSEDALFVHRKGPVEILLPAASFALLGEIDEASARLPFAVAGLVALVAVFYLGWQLWGVWAGCSAALFLALNGYLIGFARFVQYQSVVLLLSVLAVLILLRLLRRPAAVTRYLSLAALLVATGLLAHYDGLVTLIPLSLGGVILFQQQRVERIVLLRAMGFAGAVGGLLLAIFYLPFVLHPNFAATYAYLLNIRLRDGGDFLYNNLSEIAARSEVYNSPLVVLLSGALMTIALAWAIARGFGRTWGMLVGTLVGVTLFLTIGQPALFDLVWVDWLYVPFALVIGLAWLAPRLSIAERLLWLWWGAPLLLALFFVAQPGTHVYVALVPNALLIGYLLQRQWSYLHRRLGGLAAGLIQFAPLGVVGVLVCVRAYFFFAFTEVEVLHAKQDQSQAQVTDASSAPSRYTIDRLYGFPLSNGWKVVGLLYAKGVLAGDFETNQRDDLIPDWYTRGQHRCATTASWYFAVDNLEAWSAGSQDVEALVMDQGYRLWGIVTANDQPRMEIYTRIAARDGATAAPQMFPLEQYEDRFDQTATPQLALDYPTVVEPLAHPLDIDFDGQIRLEGYTLEAEQPLRPGETLRLTLYWRAQQPIGDSYKVFNQAYYGEGVMVAQSDAFPVCDRHPTNRWYPGERVVDVHDITIQNDAPAGIYPLYTGLYREADFSRLPVLDDAGNPIAEQVEVAQIRIAPP